MAPRKQKECFCGEAGFAGPGSDVVFAYAAFTQTLGNWLTTVGDSRWLECVAHWRLFLRSAHLCKCETIAEWPGGSKAILEPSDMLPGAWLDPHLLSFLTQLQPTLTQVIHKEINRKTSMLYPGGFRNLASRFRRCYATCLNIAVSGSYIIWGCLARTP